MNRDRLAIAFAFVLTALYAGAMAAALTGRAEEWSKRVNPAALHVLGGLVVVMIVLNLGRKETPKP